MRTPGLLIFGIVLAPCGLVLDLTSTVAPDWREIYTVPGTSSDFFYKQGIWDVCSASTISSTVTCGQQSLFTTYLQSQVIPVAQGLMIASLLVTLLGIGVATPGIRCWRERPNWVVAGFGGILIFLSGVMTLIPISWYTNVMKNLTSPSQDIRVGYALVLGYIGGIMEVLGGIAMVIGMCSCCGGCNRGEKSSDINTKASYTARTRDVPRKIEVPNIARSMSTTSSVPYSRESLDDDYAPRVKTHGNRSANSHYTNKPYDADL